MVWRMAPKLYCLRFPYYHEPIWDMLFFTASNTYPICTLVHETNILQSGCQGDFRDIICQKLFLKKFLSDIVSKA